MRQRDRHHILTQVIHRMAMARTITMDEQMVVACLDGLTRWSQAHSDRNGERSDHEIRQAVDRATQHLQALLDGTESAHQALSRRAHHSSHHSPPSEKNSTKSS